MGACAALAGEGGSCAAPEGCAVGLVCKAGKCEKPAGTCEVDADCGNLATCLKPSKRTCETPGAAAADCASTAECGDGLYCADTGKCAVAPGLDAPCGNGTACAKGLACDFDAAVCKPIPTSGKPCALGELGPFVCADGLGCVAGTCGALPTAGKECTTDNRCATGLACDFTATGSFCVTPKPAGGACENDQVCQAGLYCGPSGTCTASLALGKPCKDGNECGDGTCVPDALGAFTCQPKPGKGATCLFDCAAGLVCHGQPLPHVCGKEVCFAVFPLIGWRLTARGAPSPPAPLPVGPVGEGRRDGSFRRGAGGCGGRLGTWGRGARARGPRGRSR